MNNKIKTNRHNDTTEHHRSHAEIAIEEQNRPTPKKSTSRITQPPLQVKKGGIRVEAVAEKANERKQHSPTITQHNTTSSEEHNTAQTQVRTRPPIDSPRSSSRCPSMSIKPTLIASMTVVAHEHGGKFSHSLEIAPLRETNDISQETALLTVIELSAL